MISITITSPETSYIQYTGIPSPVYQYMIHLVVVLPISEVQVYLSMFRSRNVLLLTTGFFDVAVFLFQHYYHYYRVKAHIPSRRFENTFCPHFSIKIP